jgi:hypothetical protein
MCLCAEATDIDEWDANAPARSIRRRTRYWIHRDVAPIERKDGPTGIHGFDRFAAATPCSADICPQICLPRLQRSGGLEFKNDFITGSE